MHEAQSDATLQVRHRWCGCPRLVLVGEVRDCARCPFGRRLSSPCLVHHDAVERAIEDGAGKSGARLRLDAALVQVRSASWRDEAQYDVRELLLHGGHRALAGVDGGGVPEKDPRLSFSARVQHVVQCGCELQECRRDGPAVLRRDVVSALLRQDGVCLGRLHDQHVQRAMVYAEGDRECRGLLGVALQLSLFDAAAAPPDLMHRQEAAGRLVDVHDAVCADRVLVHQPAQLDEQPVRVGVLLLRAVELFHALGRLLDAQAHATQELLQPGEKAQKYFFLTIQTVTSLFFLETNLSHEEHREASQHKTSHGTNSFNDKRHTPERWRECGVCLASHPTADLQW